MTDFKNNVKESQKPKFINVIMKRLKKLKIS